MTEMMTRTILQTRRRGQRRPRGTVLIYVMVSMVVLFGFVSLAVDYGRVQLAKSELQQAADSAARFAATGINDGTAVDKAIAAANANSADGTRIEISSRDVRLGNWDANLTPKFSTTRSPTNAIQVN